MGSERWRSTQRGSERRGPTIVTPKRWVRATRRGPNDVGGPSDGGPTSERWGSERWVSER